MNSDRVLLISPSEDVLATVQESLERVNAFLTVRKLRYYPQDDELGLVLRAQGPAIVFLDAEDIGDALRVHAEIQRYSTSAQVVAVTGSMSPEIFLALMRVGVRECLPLPVEDERLNESLLRLAEVLEGVSPTEHAFGKVYSFLPSKPGSGATTICLNTARALAEAHGSRVAIIELDMTCGVIPFLLKLSSGLTICDASEYAGRMDETLWQRMITRSGKLDVLRAGFPRPEFRLDPAQVQQMIGYAQRNYPAVCIDLSGNMERFSVEAMRSSSSIFLVCTNEIASLHLAKRHMELLQAAELQERVQVIMNRVGRKDALGPQAVRDVLKVTQIETFVNDYSAVQNAIRDGVPLPADGRLGSEFRDLARRLAGKKPKGPTATSDGSGGKSGVLSLPGLKSAVSNLLSKAS